MYQLVQSRGSYIDITIPIYVTTRSNQQVEYCISSNNIIHPLVKSRGSYIDITIPIYVTTRFSQRVLYVQILNNILEIIRLILNTNKIKSHKVQLDSLFN